MLRITHYVITHHALPITDYTSRIPITHYRLRITQKNELKYYDMNAMPRVIPMCPNMNMF
jgi:hypothetical protein